MRHPLARALDSAGVDTAETAARLGVDPKTVGRWLAGRVPYPRNRAALVELTGWAARDLWPDLPHPSAPEPASEVDAVYPRCSALPVDMWRRLVLHAETEISIVTDSDVSPTGDAEVPRLLREKAATGVRIRIAVGLRDQSAGPGSLDELAGEPGICVRAHETVMYNRVYRADDELLVSPVVYTVPASQTPWLHLRRTRDDGLAATYLESFERIWESATNPDLRDTPLPA